jgi:hypothetical protein
MAASLIFGNARKLARQLTTLRPAPISRRNGGQKGLKRAAFSPAATLLFKRSDRRLAFIVFEDDRRHSAFPFVLRVS